ncbi:hypothetical protein [Longibacter salinarum]|uniref:hypothetical protein n=1 Tax=Longibacter salinarum TaxID=1850348 RepID=UPI00117EB086|nr:hypothetical protein [Longibacter salinarum]
MTDEARHRPRTTVHGQRPVARDVLLWVLLVVVTVFGLFRPRAARGQYVDEAFSRVGISNDFSIGGSVGMLGELYGTSGVSRRPTASGRLFARAQASGYGLSYDLNMVLSTEQYQFNQNARRQSINQIDLRVKYKWIEADAGTVSPRLSQYSLNGTSLKGGFLELTPGKWRITYTGGVSQRAVEPASLGSTSSATTTAGPSPRIGANAGAFQRWLHAARLGYGDLGGSYVDLIGLYGFDDASSLRDPGALSPVSNTNVTTVAGLRVLDGRIRLEGQLTASGLVNDTQAPRSDTSPGLLYDLGIMNARAGSQMDYAGRLSARVDVLKRGQLQMSYERIQPGFRSLGLAYLRSDQEVIQIRPRVDFFDGKLRLDAQLGQRRNNLNGDLQSTLRRRQARMNAQVRLSRTFFVSTSYSRLVNANTAMPGVQDVATFRQVSQTVSVAPSLTFRRGSLTHSSALTASLQTLRDRQSDPNASGASFTNYSGTLSHTVAFPSGTSVGLSGNALMSQRAATDLVTVSVNANVSRSLLDRALRVNASGGWSSNRVRIDPASMVPTTTNTSRQFTATSTVRYRIPVMGDVSFRLRALRSSQPQGGSFNEVQSTIRYEYRF